MSTVAPEYTLDAVEAIVTHPEVRIAGLLLTLKLLEWDLAAELPVYLERIRSWGYPHVAARQLHHGRQEVCVVATSDKAQRARAGPAAAAREEQSGERISNRHATRRKDDSERV